MAFSWRRIRGHLAGRSNRPRDAREDWAMLGHHAEAPAYRVAPAPFRVYAHDWNTLHGAAALGYTRLLRRLLERGASPDVRDAWGRTALYAAVEDGRRTSAELLLAHGADPDLRDETGRAPLHAAVLRGDRELARLLLKGGATADVGAGDAPTPLMEAVRRGDSRMVALLLESGAHPKTIDRFGHTALFFVRGDSASQTLAPLLDAGADPAAIAGDGDTAPFRALRMGDLGLWKALTPGEDERAQLDRRGRNGDPPLVAVAEGGNVALLRRLIALGADPNETNRFGQSPLLLALTAENLPAATVLTGAGAQVGFAEAVALGDLEKAQAARRPPARALDTPIMGHETLLMGAVARERTDLVELLLDAGASPDAGTALIGTPLDVAALTGQTSMVRRLLERGADPSLARKVSPAELRRMARAVEEAPPLPPLGADRPDTEAVYEAAVAGDDGALQFLRLCGGDVDARDGDGWTALLHAARDGDEAAVRRLLAFGASPRHRAPEGESALDIARRHRRAEVAALLEEIG